MMNMLWYFVAANCGMNGIFDKPIKINGYVFNNKVKLWVNWYCIWDIIHEFGIKTYDFVRP